MTDGEGDVLPMTDYANVPAHAQRWLEFVTDDQGKVDWAGYEALTTWVPLRDFLDLEEVSVVLRDRAAAWESFMKKNPDVLKEKAAPEGVDPRDFIVGATTFTPPPK